jgi:hypothetical protein
MNTRLKELLQGIEQWSEADQAELADALEQIKIRHRGEYSATPEELQALDEADSSGIASEQDVEAAFRTFRRA